MPLQKWNVKKLGKRALENPSLGGFGTLQTHLNTFVVLFLTIRSFQQRFPHECSLAMFLSSLPLFSPCLISHFRHSRLLSSLEPSCRKLSWAPICYTFALPSPCMCMYVWWSESVFIICTDNESSPPSRRFKSYIIIYWQTCILFISYMSESILGLAHRNSFFFLCTNSPVRDITVLSSDWLK